jgi:hypothetical protein
MIEVSTSRQRCAATRKDGSPCGGYAIAESVYCFSHDPKHAGAIAEARRRGGRARHGRRIGATGDAEAVTLATLDDVLQFLERAVNDVLTLENSINRARALGYLAGAWGTLYESSELERRVAALEALNENQNSS